MGKYEKIITKVMQDMGIPAHLKGYNYIRYGVGLLVEDISRIDQIVVLYGDIAEHFNDELYRAERAIRHAIETGWSRGNVELQRKLFGYTVDYNKGKPTNGEFLATVADYILMMDKDSLMSDDGKEVVGKIVEVLNHLIAELSPQMGLKNTSALLDITAEIEHMVSGGEGEADA